MIKEEQLQENSQEVGTYLLLKLAKLRDEFEIIGDVRGKGLMVGIEMVKDKVGPDLLLSLCGFWGRQQANSKHRPKADSIHSQEGAGSRGCRRVRVGIWKRELVFSPH